VVKWRASLPLTVVCGAAALLSTGCSAVPGPAPGSADDAPSDRTAAAGPGADTGSSVTTKVAVPLRGEDFHLEIATEHFTSTLDSGPPSRARCTIRLCRADGRLAGPASMGRASPAGDLQRGGWTDDFSHGEEATLLFRRESDGMFWRVVVVPRFSAGGIQWTVIRAELICIR
jgi:hypothetical protein